MMLLDITAKYNPFKAFLNFAFSPVRGFTIAYYGEDTRLN